MSETKMTKEQAGRKRALECFLRALLKEHRRMNRLPTPPMKCIIQPSKNSRIRRKHQKATSVFFNCLNLIKTSEANRED